MKKAVFSQKFKMGAVLLTRRWQPLQNGWYTKVWIKCRLGGLQPEQKMRHSQKEALALNKGKSWFLFSLPVTTHYVMLIFLYSCYLKRSSTGFFFPYQYQKHNVGLIKSRCGKKGVFQILGSPDVLIWSGCFVFNYGGDARISLIQRSHDILGERCLCFANFHKSELWV